MEVYVDDMLVNRLNAEDHIGHFQRDVWNSLVEANPEKIKALIDMRSPSSSKEVQSLTGRLTALNRFISKATNCCQPFFQTFKGGKWFEWTENVRMPSENSKPCSERLICCPNQRIERHYSSTSQYLRWCPDGHNLNCALRLEFKASNNTAENEALLIPRIENGYADALFKLANSKDSDLMRAILFEKLNKPSIDEAVPLNVMVINESSK
ncbi:DNA/RNA polymerase superfamily protein [Abeliophyllum distichum]|uniref:DNA/RNA polymerase superfamily protein n=1 Tax=Abeliophyllum distichum TaxID=126358 RepID=A0ABD1QJ19_9LAMI